MNALAAIIEAEYCGQFRIRLGFSDGVRGVVDFSDWLTGEVFEPLKNTRIFARFFIDDGTVAGLMALMLHRNPYTNVLRRVEPPPNKALQTDQGMLSCLLHSQGSRQLSFADELDRCTAATTAGRCKR